MNLIPYTECIGNLVPELSLLRPAKTQQDEVTSLLRDFKATGAAGLGGWRRYFEVHGTC